MIPSMHIENFKCFKSFDIDLDPFTVLVGANGSGKTALMQAIRLLGAVSPDQSVAFQELSSRLKFPFDKSIFWNADVSGELMIRVPKKPSSGSTSILAESFGSVTDSPANDTASIGLHILSVWDRRGTASDAVENREKRARVYQKHIGEVGYYRFDSCALKSSAKPDESGLGADGAGFVTYLSEFVLKDRAAFSRFEATFYQRFQDFKHLELKPNKTTKQLELWFHTKFGAALPASAVSDGEILCLAYLAVAHHPDSPHILLIEEPENGIHHARLAEVVNTLRGLTEANQVQMIVTTHSPFLLDLVQPENVRVFTKDKEGAAHATRMSDVPDVEKWKKHFMSGEIWTSISEEELVGKARGAKSA